MKTLEDLIKGMSELEKSLNEVRNSFAGAGWDNSPHPTARVEGQQLSFAALAYLHEYGSLEGTDKEVPARRLFFTTLMTIEKESSKDIQRIILTNLRKYGKIRKSQLLTDLANFVKSELERIMGDPAYLLDNTEFTQNAKGGKNTPLVDSGALVNNIITSTGEK
tara:strand:- start:28004 stop:28495 length:492 start_codon:yes stop_codon:yes gene_type:complete